MEEEERDVWKRTAKRSGEDDDDDDEDDELGQDEAEAKRRRRGHTESWTAVEEAQLKKAMIVLGNKKWKDMAKYFPQKSATQLRFKYKAMGGAWNQLKPIMHEHRYLDKAGKLGERDPMLTDEEKRLVEEGGELVLLFEKPLSAPSKRGNKDDDDDDSNNSDDDDDDDHDDDEDDHVMVHVASSTAQPKSSMKRKNKPVSAVLLRLSEEQIDNFKKKRVAEILEQNAVKKEFEHKSMAHLNRLRQMIPPPAPPPEAVYGVYMSMEDVTAKVAGLITSRLFGTASADGRTCASMSLDQPAEATLESSRVFLRAPTFLKAVSGKDDGPMMSHTPEEWIAVSKAAEANKEKKLALSLKIPPTTKGGVAPSVTAPAPQATAPKGVMKPGLARPKVAPAPVAAVRPTVKKKKTSDASAGGGSSRLRVEPLSIPLMDQYMRRHLMPESLVWSDFRRSIALEQHINAVVKRSAGDSAQDTLRIAVATGCADEKCHLLDAASLGGSVVRSLRLGEPEKTSTGAIQSVVYLVTHWLPSQHSDATVREPISRTNLARVNKGDTYAGALHPSGLIAAVAIGPTITVFDLGPASPIPGQGGSAKPVSIHQESNFPITHLNFSHHTPKNSYLCSYDGQALRVWQAWTNEQSRKFITPLTHGDISAPYVVSTTLLQSFRDPLPDPNGPYDIVWHPRGDMFVTYSSAVAKVWRFQADDPVRNASFEHRVLEGIVSVSFLPDLATEVLVVLTTQQKLKFIDLKRPNDFAKSCSTVQGLPWAGFILHRHHPKLVYGVTLNNSVSSSSAVTALHIASLTNEDDDSQLKVSMTYFGVPLEVRNESALAQPELLTPRSRAILLLDAQASTMIWFDATKASFVCAKLLPSE